MKKVFFFNLFLLILTNVFGNNAVIEGNIQDIIVNGQVIQSGIRDCGRRYEALKFLLDQYKRPITVLDLGAAQGYFSFRIAKDYDSTCVMMEEDEKDSKKLLELCHLNSQLQNIVFLKTKINLADLDKLGDCEHFDVVLAFDFVSPDDPNWKRTIDTVLHLGENIIFEIPTSNDPKILKNGDMNKVEKYLCEQNGKLLLETPCEFDSAVNEKMYWIHKVKKGLRCNRFNLASKDSNMKKYAIESSFTNKFFIKSDYTKPVPWQKGINFVTFLMLNGVYPSKDKLKQEIINVSVNKLSDFAPWNILVQGNCLVLIDQNSTSWNVNLKKSLNFILKVVDQSSRSEILKLFKGYRKLHVRRLKKKFLFF